MKSNISYISKNKQLPRFPFIYYPLSWFRGRQSTKSQNLCCFLRAQLPSACKPHLLLNPPGRSLWTQNSHFSEGTNKDSIQHVLNKDIYTQASGPRGTASRQVPHSTPTSTSKKGRELPGPQECAATCWTTASTTPLPAKATEQEAAGSAPFVSPQGL